MVSQNNDTSGRDGILLVHGSDFKPGRETLLDISSEALRAGIQRDFPDRVESFDALPVDIAYYGDLSNEFLLARGGRYDPPLDVGDRRNALNSLRAIDARKRFNLRQYDSLPGKSAIPEALADIIFPVLGYFGLALPLISSKSKDFAEYLRNGSELREQVRARVRAKLLEMLKRGDRVLVIAHGTGCVVVYDVLWELSHDEKYKYELPAGKVDLWLTMGSPLSDRNVRKRLAGADRKSVEQFPANIVTWLNMSAEDDFVCHDMTVADDFRKMMREHIVSVVKDYRIYNLTVRYGKSNPHSSLGYFIHPRTSKIITDWMGRG